MSPQPRTRVVIPPHPVLSPPIAILTVMELIMLTLDKEEPIYTLSLGITAM